MGLHELPEALLGGLEENLVVPEGVVGIEGDHVEHGAILPHGVTGNVYFPPDSLNRQYLQPSGHHTTCGWKGEASYHHVVVEGQENRDAAWYYPDPKPAAASIRDHVAFWRGVQVER